VLGTTLTDQNFVYLEVKSRRNAASACCDSVYDFPSFYLLSKNVNIAVYVIVILRVSLYECETWSLTLTIVKCLGIT
jgi:hypothetical protein